MKILWIDDEISDLGAVIELLKSEGFDVETAENGFEGIKKVKEKTYDFILLDYKMPNLDGIEVLKVINSIRPNVPVIMLTAISDKEIIEKAIGNDVYDYILTHKAKLFLHLLSSLKFLKDEEIAWLYELKYKDLNEKLITYIELKLKSIYNKIPFDKLNPFSIYKPRYEFFLLFVFSLALLVFSFTFRQPLYIANYGNYQRVVKIFGNDEFFLGEDIILKIKNYSFLKEKLILKPTNYSLKLSQ